MTREPTSLPTELWTDIFSRVPAEDLWTSCRLVSRAFHFCAETTLKTEHIANNLAIFYLDKGYEFSNFSPDHEIAWFKVTRPENSEDKNYIVRINQVVNARLNRFGCLILSKSCDSVVDVVIDPDRMDTMDRNASYCIGCMERSLFGSNEKVEVDMETGMIGLEWRAVLAKYFSREFELQRCWIKKPNR